MDNSVAAPSKPKFSDIKIALMLAPVGIIAGALVGLYQEPMIDPELLAEAGVTSEILALTAAIQSGILTLIAVFFGLKAARRVGLLKPIALTKRGSIAAALAALVTAVIITLSDKLLFAQFIPELADQTAAYEFSPIYFASGLLYGGIIEELLMRLLLMSGIALALWKLLDRSSTEKPSDWVFVASILAAAALFAIGHWGANDALFGMDVAVFARMMILNGFGGVLFGWLYWKHGIQHAILAHAGTHFFNQAVLMPIFFS